MFNVAICCSQNEDMLKIDKYLLKISMITNYTFCTEYFSSGDLLFNRINKKELNPFHILILEIELRDIDGIELAKKIRMFIGHDIQIVFMSNNPKYIMNIFDVQAYHYLIKPVSYTCFEKRIISLCKHLCSREKSYLTIKIAQDEIILVVSDIISFEMSKCFETRSLIKIRTIHKEYLINGTLSEYTNKLANQFLLIHRSILVNMDYIEKFSTNKVFMSNGVVFPLSRTRAKLVKNTFTKFMIAEFK